MARFAPFLDAYIDCALWSSLDEQDKPLDESYDWTDLSPACYAEMRQDCYDFCATYWDDIAGNLVRAGHDFWLTRNGHGAGFWDGDWPQTVGQRLTKAAKIYGSVDLVIGKDGLIYC
jgi:hypothetical protein